MARPIPLTIFDRSAGRLVQDWMDDAPSHYESRPRRSPTQWIESQPIFDWLVESYQNSRWSKRKIAPFIEKHQINMHEFEPREYQSFNDFFVRRFRQGARQFPTNPKLMGACAEARYFGWKVVDDSLRFPIKGHSLDPKQIFGSAYLAETFQGGPALLIRLAPVDYHRFHYVDDGITVDADRIGGRLWTINRRALQNKPDILFQNERHVQILETRNFGRLGLAEIGAMTVGRVTRTHRIDQPFRRGDEKGYFSFGGSAIVVFGEPGAWKPSDDIVENTMAGFEVYLRLGDVVAEAPNA